MEKLVWTADNGVHHRLPNMPDLDPRLRAVINQLRSALDTAAAALQHRPITNDKIVEAEDLMQQATEAADLILRFLIPGVTQEEIARRDPVEKINFLTRWFVMQPNAQFPSPPTA